MPGLFFVFCFGGHAAPDMALLLVEIQDFSDPVIQDPVALFEPLRQILMYGGFGNAEMPWSGAVGGTGFDYVHSQFAGPLLNGGCHMLPSDAVCYRKQPMPVSSDICTLTDTFPASNI